jgi:protein SCO1/2
VCKNTKYLIARMRKEWIKPIIAFLVIVIFLGGAYYFSQNNTRLPVLPYYSHGIKIDPVEYTSVLKSAITPVSDFIFFNQKGDTITYKNFVGHIYIANYIFTTCPGICKDMTHELRRVYKRFEKNDKVKILSHTSKPEEDNIPVLMEYAKSLGVTNHEKWSFVSGNIDDLFNMALNEYQIINPDEYVDGNTFVHTEKVALVDQEGFVRGYYDATNPKQVDLMMSDIELLLNEHPS